MVVEDAVPVRELLSDSHQLRISLASQLFGDLVVTENVAHEP